MQKPKSNEQNLPELSKYQKFTVREIHRRNLKNAPYNPRTINETNRKRLKKKMKDEGLLSTIIWNERTGHIVSGHQRISVLDELEKKDDYLITVSVINVEENKEKEINVFLNNATAQGEYDFDMLKEMFQIPDLDPESFGFDVAEVKWLLGEYENEKDNQQNQSTIDEEISKIEKIRAAKKSLKNAANAKDDAEFYLVAVFQTRAEADALLTAIDAPDTSRYIDGLRILDLLGLSPQKGEDGQTPETV